MYLHNMNLHNTPRLLARIAAKACRKNAKAVAMRGYILNNVSEKKHI
jgi:hypothetical protein